MALAQPLPTAWPVGPAEELWVQEALTGVPTGLSKGSRNHSEMPPC